MDKEQQITTAKLLSALEPGFLPYEIFKQIARLVALPIIEFVPLRFKNKNLEVLLVKRPADDDIWPGELHTPGTVLRATDLGGDLNGAFDRIMNDELKGLRVGKPYFVGTIFHKGKRGAEHAQVFWVEALEEPAVGKFYPIDNLPHNTMEQQQKFIMQAAKSYTNFKQANNHN